MIQVEKKIKNIKVDQKILMKGSKHESFPTQSRKQLERRINSATSILQTLKTRKKNIQKELNQANKNISKLIQQEQKKV